MVAYASLDDTSITPPAGDGPPSDTPAVSRAEHSARPVRPNPSPGPPPGADSSADPANEDRWLSMDAACKLIGVDQSTLRRWSDGGKIPVFRTPGGHRRYHEDDLRALMRGEQRRRRVSRSALTNRSMSAYEPDYLRQAHQRPWFNAYDTRAMETLRPLGRRLVDLTIRFVSSRSEREVLLSEALDIGREYGLHSARVGHTTAEAVEAFLFFRTPVIHAVTAYIEDENVSLRRAARITSELTLFLDQVLMETVRATTGVHAPERPAAPNGHSPA